MTKVGEVYKCEACGNVVEVKETGEGELVCCDQPMVKQQSRPESPDAAQACNKQQKVLMKKPFCCFRFRVIKLKTV